MCCALATGLAHSGCERQAITNPEAGSHISEVQPEVRWTGNSRVRYRLQLAVVLPEGRVLESTDMWVVGTSWRMPAPVNVPTAAVKVIVSRDCPDFSGQDLSAEPAHFTIDTRATCVAAGESLRQAGAVLHWEVLPQATGYVVRLHAVQPDPDSGATVHFLQTAETSDPAWTLPHGGQQALRTKIGSAGVVVASVQARCGSLTGPVQSVVLRAWP